MRSWPRTAALDIVSVCFGSETGQNLPLLLVGLGELELDSVDAVYAVNEENQDEDKGNLHPILKFRYDRTLRASLLLVEV